MNAEYEDVSKLVTEFCARLREYTGVQSVLIAWEGLDQNSGGYHYDGNPATIYAIAKRYVLKQEARWSSVTNQSRREENG